MTAVVLNDAAGVPRHISFPTGKPVAGLAALGPQAQADDFLLRDGGLLALPAAALGSLARPLASWPEPELSELRGEALKRVMDSHVVGYSQTYFGLPVVGAGLSVTLRDQPREVLAASSSVHHAIQVVRPSDEAIKAALAIFTRPAGTAGMRLSEAGLATDEPGSGAGADAHLLAGVGHKQPQVVAEDGVPEGEGAAGARAGEVREGPEAVVQVEREGPVGVEEVRLDEAQRETRVNAVRLVVYRFVAANRAGEPQGHPSGTTDPGLQEEKLPSLPLPPLPDAIRDGGFYVAVEVYLTLTTPPWGRLNWLLYLDVASRAILQLKPLVDHASAAVFLRDPITKGSGLAPSATTLQLNPLRDAFERALGDAVRLRSGGPLVHE